MQEKYPQNFTVKLFLTDLKTNNTVMDIHTCSSLRQTQHSGVTLVTLHRMDGKEDDKTFAVLRDKLAYEELLTGRTKHGNLLNFAIVHYTENDSIVDKLIVENSAATTTQVVKRDNIRGQLEYLNHAVDVQ